MQTDTRSRAMLAISDAWRIPFSLGTPDTTISTAQTLTSHISGETQHTVGKLRRRTSIADGFHFIDIIVVDDLVEGGVEFVEEIHHLVRSAGAGQLRESHDITEKTTGDHRKRDRRRSESVSLQ